MHTWIWAELNPDQLALIAEAEQSLGADYLLVYRNDDAAGNAVVTTQPGLYAASLTASQLECLHGVEMMLQAVVVAYSSNPAA